MDYADLDGRANQLANGLLARGVRAGQRVAELIGNENRFVEALLGTWRAGAVAVLPNTRLRAAQVAGQVLHAEVSVVLASAEMAVAARAMRARSHNADLPGRRV